MDFFDTSIVEQIEMKMIRVSQYGIRDRSQRTSDEDNYLISSIKDHGLLQPILIRPYEQGFEIVAGHRRFQACRSLRWRFIPCKIRDLTDKEAFEIQLTENMQRKSMDPIEEAEAFRRYVVDFGWGGMTELASKIGKSEEYVSHRIQLLKLPEEIKLHIASKSLKVSSAMELTNISSDKQNILIRQIASQGLTIRQIRGMKARMKAHSFSEPGSESRGETEIRFTGGSTRVLKITKKTSLALRVTLARLDTLIDEVHTTVEPARRGDIINFLMGIRLTIHSLIDETIKYRNFTSKRIYPKR